LNTEYQAAAEREYSMATKRKPIKTILLISGGALLFVLLLAAVIIWNVNVFSVQVQMNGQQEITVEYGDTFTDPGAEATFCGTLLARNPRDVTVSVSGAVDDTKLGTYELTYSAEYVLDFLVGKLVFQDTCTRNVVVVDTCAPEIVLVSSPDAYTLPTETYKEEGFTATDNYDGDLTALVERSETAEQITYKVTDTAGNVTEVVRKIVYDDPIPPEITLVGDNIVVLLQGAAYTESGFSAVDNCAGDITDRVKVTGEVDINRLGSYTLEYTVTDDYDNTTTVTRTVNVSDIPQVPGLPHTQYQTPAAPNGKVVYLTFDDGPCQYTPKLLDVLDKYGVKATFFVVYADNAALLSRMASSGHTVAMHSATHDYATIYSSEDAYFNDLYIVQSKIAAAIGYKPMMLRFPGGSSNTVSRSYCSGIMTQVTQKLKNMGYRYFDWNVDSRDVSGADTANKVYYNVVSGIYNNTVSFVLQHDIRSQSVDAVEKIIQWGLANGYTFLPLSMDSPPCEHRINN